MFLAQSYNIDCTCLNIILYSVGAIMSPLSTPSQQGYHVQTVKPLTFILQLPNSSVRCNCAIHQPELGLLNCPPQSFILLQYRDYHVPNVPPNFHSITAIANIHMYNLFLKHSSLSHAFVCQDFQLTECFMNTYIMMKLRIKIMT